MREPALDSASCVVDFASLAGDIRVAVAETARKRSSASAIPAPMTASAFPRSASWVPPESRSASSRIEVALRLAQEADLDLVEVAPNSKPPVVKIMDYGKFKYEAAQKAKEARRNQANTILKEVRFRLKIEAHDYKTKLKRAEGFLKTGDKVKAMILFRGREQSRPEQGVRLLRKFAEDVAEFGTVESNPTIDGRNMVMVIAPHKNKSEVKTEQNAQRAANKKARPAADAPDAAESADRPSPPSRPQTPPPGPDSRDGQKRRRNRDAEAEDPLGCQEALQGHRQRKAHEAAGRHAPQPRGQGSSRARVASTRTRSCRPGDAKVAKKLLGR